MRILAYSLFVGGIALAVTGGAKLPAHTGAFPDTWWVFAIGGFAAAVGVALWRLQEASGRQPADLQKEPQQGPALLHSLVPLARKLEAEVDTLDAEQVMDRVGQLLEQYVLPFAEVRRGIIDRFGMSAGAEILVTVAVGERMLNRTWSAAADGHLQEARSSLPEAVCALEQAERLMQQQTRKLSRRQ